MNTCELQGCQSTGDDKHSVGTFQVYDEDLGHTPTMTRPAHLCQRCIDFAKQCGMTVEAA